MMKDLLKTTLFTILIILAWENRHSISTFAVECWNNGIEVRQ